MLAIVPGLDAGLKLHPFQYTYYNSFVGGTGRGRIFRFETDYWLTCYKEALEQLASFADEPINLYVQREYYIAEYYATDQITVKDRQGKDKLIGPGDYILWSSRANPDLQRYRDPNQASSCASTEKGHYSVRLEDNDDFSHRTTSSMFARRSD